METLGVTHQVALGSIQPGPVQFIRQVVVEKETAPFEIDLPGQITRCEGTGYFAILPYARVVLDKGGHRRAATVTASVLDEDGLTVALDALMDAVRGNKFDSFSIRISSRLYSFADVVAAAEKAIGEGGCGCGKGSDNEHGSGVGRLPGMLSVGLGTGQKIRWSDPVHALIAGRAENQRTFAPTKSGDAVCWNAFDCHSHWYCDWFYRNRQTVCHGPCPGKQWCACGRNGRKTPVGNCKGWTTCLCL